MREYPCMIRKLARFSPMNMPVPPFYLSLFQTTFPVLLNDTSYEQLYKEILNSKYENREKTSNKIENYYMKALAIVQMTYGSNYKHCGKGY
ncbi:twin-arginine translocation system protein, TatB [Paenibacillus sp. NAIST15-1]|nr:twin-arginine translocation system protein, TatB [Paenibacillus sp. NAIST15-1]